jgi:two-component system sensor histidine kinase DctS
VARKLFTPFFTTKAEGMGLGLSLCRTVVEQHGGFLGFAPSPPQGTVFRFTLPVRRGLSVRIARLQPCTRRQRGVHRR